MLSISAVKMITSLVVGSSSAKVMHHVLRHNLYAPQTKLLKLQYLVGEAAIAGAVAAAAVREVDSQIDEIVETYEKYKQEQSEKKES